REGLFLEMSDAEWTSVLGTNLDGVYLCARLAARQMLGHGWGRIVNVSSVLVSRAGRGQVNYAASKGGVNALTRALANELAGHGVTVNAIAPGLIETDMSRPFIGVAAKKIREWIPMRRVGRPSEVRVSVGKIIVESLGVDEAMVTDDAALVRDLGAESIDFLDMSFKCQQTFGVDLPVRLIQDRRIEWRDLGGLAKVIRARYGVAAAPEELRTVAPATAGAILDHLAAKHGVRRADGDEGDVV